MRGKTPVFPIQHLNNFSVSFQVFVPFTYGTGVQPISLTSTEPPAGSLAVVSGWGRLSSGGIYPSQLQAVELYVTSRAACNSAYDYYCGITENMICAAVSGGGKNSCQGDSGSPLVIGSQLVGVVFWGVGCAEDEFPGVYSNVATLRSFVTENTGVQQDADVTRCH